MPITPYSPRFSQLTPLPDKPPVSNAPHAMADTMLNAMPGVMPGHSPGMHSGSRHTANLAPGATPGTWKMVVNHQPVTDWQIVHERPMHAFWISDDLTRFVHFHPTVLSDGSLAFIPPASNGKVLLQGRSRQNGDVEAIHRTGQPFSTASAVTARPALKPTPAWVSSDGKPPVFGTLKHTGHNGYELNLADETGLPLPGVEALLGAPAHAVAADSRLALIQHVHPMSPLLNNGALLPLRFHLPKAYNQPHKWWLQVQFKGQVHTLAFVLPG